MLIVKISSQSGLELYGPYSLTFEYIFSAQRVPVGQYVLVGCPNSIAVIFSLTAKTISDRPPTPAPIFFSPTVKPSIIVP